MANQSKPQTCYNCRQKGHLARECPQQPTVRRDRLSERVSALYERIRNATTDEEIDRAQQQLLQIRQQLSGQQKQRIAALERQKAQLKANLLSTPERQEGASTSANPANWSPANVVYEDRPKSPKGSKSPKKRHTTRRERQSLSAQFSAQVVAMRERMSFIISSIVKAKSEKPEDPQDGVVYLFKSDGFLEARFFKVAPASSQEDDDNTSEISGGSWLDDAKDGESWFDRYDNEYVHEDPFEGDSIEGDADSYDGDAEADPSDDSSSSSSSSSSSASEESFSSEEEDSVSSSSEDEEDDLDLKSLSGVSRADSQDYGLLVAELGPLEAIQVAMAKDLQRQLDDNDTADLVDEIDVLRDAQDNWFGFLAPILAAPVEVAVQINVVQVMHDVAIQVEIPSEDENLPDPQEEIPEQHLGESSEQQLEESVSEQPERKTPEPPAAVLRTLARRSHEQALEDGRQISDIIHVFGQQRAFEPAPCPDYRTRPETDELDHVVNIIAAELEKPGGGDQSVIQEAVKTAQAGDVQALVERYLQTLGRVATLNEQLWANKQEYDHDKATLGRLYAAINSRVDQVLVSNQDVIAEIRELARKNHGIRVGQLRPIKDLIQTYKKLIRENRRTIRGRARRN